jgi:hypothetical protein
MKFTDIFTFHPPVKKIHVAKMPEGAPKLMLSIGAGGKGSEYLYLSPEEGLELARYLTVEAHRAMDPTAAKARKKGA